METWTEKVEKLKEKIHEYTTTDVMVAFSGGADSSLVLKLACDAAEKNRTKVYAVTMQTKLHPLCEMENARKVADEIGAVSVVIPVDELLEAGIGENPKNRCYLCKRHLFCRMKEEAKRLGAARILEGTNEEDLHVYRPGQKALKELGIISPLAEAGFTKEEVRRLSAEYGLSTASRPAAPCLATRFPYGVCLSYGQLSKVEQGETYVRSFGVRNVRLRIHSDVVRIEVDEADFPVLLANKKEIAAYLRALGYGYITLDIEGFRSGSMDEGREGSFQ